MVLVKKALARDAVAMVSGREPLGTGSSRWTAQGRGRRPQYLDCLDILREGCVTWRYIPGTVQRRLLNSGRGPFPASSGISAGFPCLTWSLRVRCGPWPGAGSPGYQICSLIHLTSGSRQEAGDSEGEAHVAPWELTGGWYV